MIFPFRGFGEKLDYQRAGIVDRWSNAGTDEDSGRNESGESGGDIV
jgi:hypothetical protein